ncbi:hypothetical protein [Sphingomonas oryzagri]|uniref:Uncharacterized protein n=1 Tax=Sphingomonas oryzagri TaxID=3042314 RepID=A0ABT6N7U2_9SPHN|nr:hypothetical protein [Sphingomonas oryzagri]MDH7641186.1 hypothetical protein [Sphingomonas oryzagri]
MTLFRLIPFVCIAAGAALLCGGSLGCALIGAALGATIFVLAACDPVFAAKLASLLATIKASYAVAKAKIEAFIARLRARTEA